MTPPESFLIEDIPYRYEFIYDDFDRFKSITNTAFSYDKDEFRDLLGLAVYDKNRLIVITGLSKDGKFTASLGCEKFYFDHKYKRLVSLSLKVLCRKFMDNFPDICPVSMTQFSHTKSMNLSLSLGFKYYSCLVGDYINN